MNNLIINSCNSNLLVLLKKDDEIFIKNELGIKKHNEIILDLVKQILNENKISLNDIDEFGVVVGPGSFTGIRVGIATIKAFKDALKKDARGINNLNYLFELGNKRGLEIVAIQGSLNSYFVAEKIENGLHIYPHNMDEESLIKLANGRVIGCFELTEQMKNSKLQFEQLEEDEKILVEVFNKSKDRQLTPIYYQLSQAEAEKINKAKIEYADISKEDLKEVLKIDNNNFNLELNGELPWTEEYFSSLLTNSTYKNYAIKLNGELVGYAILELTDELNISRIAIAKDYQSQGLGTKLINEIFKLAKSLKMKVSLEVCEHNINAIKLYQKLGFNIRRVRKNYYKDASSCLEMVKEI